ncbi:MAG TPA: class I SAM-dependent methyltransferase [Proteobacteria bacterium]|nr:class I SAM-dependent methyltransferase [Pseudomonadota bacterium]
MSEELLLTPQFWRDYVLSRKRSLKRSKVATGGKWDQIAGHYHSFENDAAFLAEQLWIKEKMLAHRMLSPQTELIDIACGPGTHCFDFAAICRQVTAVDVSERMIARVIARKEAEKTENLTVICHDFYGFNPACQYDTVFVSMSPILNELENIDRLLAMSRRFVVLVYWAGIRDNPLFQTCYKMVYDETYRWDAMDVTVIFNYLYALGHSPEISYLHPVWKRYDSLENTVEHIIWHLEFQRSLSSDERQMVYERIAREVDDKGMVKYQTRVRKGALFLDLEAGKEVGVSA